MYVSNTDGTYPIESSWFHRIPSAMGVGPKKACGKPMKAPGIERSNSLDADFLPQMSWILYGICMDTGHIQLISYEKWRKIVILDDVIIF